ncbi:MAG: polysaccharide deacetylase family protein [Magnetococcales bacterium]|nr:polysaccharide deacetylase family protein [Magnetococcales bacterium]NGZ06748.1 polysaccharide deacetylase family protein [Magnetococcales bacterium]
MSYKCQWVAAWLLLVLCFGHAWDSWAVEKNVYLTFDDGPREGTKEILELLTRAGLPATFFIVGGHIINAERREVFAQLKVAPLIQLANHSFTHAYEKYQSFYANPDGMLVDLSKNNEILGFVQPPFPTRLPGRIDWRFGEHYIDTRSYPVQSPAKVPAGVARLHEHGFVIYGWDVEWGRPGRKNPLEPVESLVKRIHRRLETGQTVKPGHLVLLMHDFHFNTAAALAGLQRLIDTLKQDGVLFKNMKDY